ncbi:MAG: serine/threonine-protein kinase, partial [Myxococcota bacterium]
MELLSVDAEPRPSPIDVALRGGSWQGAVSFRPGDKVGRYEILDQIGEGGFAVVYLAQEGEVRRRVALKTLKAGMHTRLVLTRFEAERQTLALMNHPFIAQVFDAGATEQGLPYLVMEYVEGTPITEHCARYGLGLEERLRLLIKCCEAVQHAHLKAIIHRDLKPSNILVRRIDGRSVPKIIDFGVAKAIGHKLTPNTLHTAGGVLVGTPAYMSPEQLGVEDQTGTDTRVDVYALGVLLYELLVGKRPFGSAKPGPSGLAEVLRAIREEEAPRPSAGAPSQALPRAPMGDRPPPFLRRQLSGDLDWMTLKALAKDRDRRYDSPRELAADLERYLAKKPIKARPPSVAYRAIKFLRRNAAAVAASGVVSLCLLILAGGAVMQAQRERRAQRELLKVAEFQAARFEDIDAYRMGEQLRRDLLAQLNAPGSEASPEGAHRLDRANFTTLAAAAIESHFFAPSLAAIEAHFADQPEVKARLLQSLVDEMAVSGALGRATVAQEEALALRRRALGDKHPDTLESIHGIGALLHEQGRIIEAELTLREAVAGRREVLGDTDPLTLDSIERLGVLLRERGHFSEAERYYREALEGRRLVLGARNDDTLIAIGNLLENQGKLEEAEEFYVEALDVQRQTLGEEHLSTLQSHANLGYVLFRQNKYDEAEYHILRAIEGSRKTLGDDHLTTLD